MAPSLLFVSHNASRSGAPRLLLGLLGWLRDHTDADIATVLLDGGPLVDEFRRMGPVLSTEDVAIEAPPADLIYLNSIGSAPALRHLATVGAPVITHVHEQHHALTDWIGERDRRALVERTTRFIVVSDVVGDDLARLPGVDRARIVRHHGFVDVDALAGPWDGSACREELAIPGNHLVVGASGTTEWRKGPDLFVDLGRRLLADATQGVDLLWVGGAPIGPEIDPVLADRDRLGLTPSVHFLGEQPNPYDWFTAMDVFVLVSRADPFPLTVLEASVLGVPVVSFDQSGAREFLTDDCGVVVPYPDVGALASAVGDLLGHPARREAMAEAAGARVRRENDLPVGAARLWAEIESVLVAAG